jgi:hypothetical protein
MRLQGAPAPRVVSISLKARSAINLGGHRPDAVIWLDELNGEWVTSTAFATGTAPYFADYIATHPLRNEIGRPWDRALPKDRYLYDGSAQGRQKTALITKRLSPHRQVVTAPKWAARSPMPGSRASLRRLPGWLAGAALDSLKLRARRRLDYLGIASRRSTRSVTISARTRTKCRTS